MNSKSVTRDIRVLNASRVTAFAIMLIVTSIALQVKREQPAAALECSIAMAYLLEPGDPQLDNRSVTSTGTVTQFPKWYCLVDSVWLRGQTKVCGFWGCNWHTKASVGDNGRTSPWSARVSQDCRTGTHRYRTETGIGYRVLTGFLGVIPTHSYLEDRGYSVVKPEFSCD